MDHRKMLMTCLALPGALALAGCTSGESSPPAEPVETAGASPSAMATTDEVTCAASGDLQTIIQNADIGFLDGRMSAQEQQGWYRLATRVLEFLPTRGEGAVHDAVEVLKGIAPADPPGTATTTGIESTEWNPALQSLSKDCADAGLEAANEMFTGG